MTWVDYVKNLKRKSSMNYSILLKIVVVGERHSTNVYYNMDNEPTPHFTGIITGSLTRKKFHNKIYRQQQNVHVPLPRLYANKFILSFVI